MHQEDDAELAGNLNIRFMQYQEDDMSDTCEGDVFAVFTRSQAQVAQPPANVKNDDSIQIKDSQRLLVTIAKHGAPIPNPPKDNSILKDIAKDRSVSSSIIVNFFVPVSSSAPALKNSVPHVLSSQNENSN